MTVVNVAEYGYLETPYLSEFPYLQPAREDGVGIQFDGFITQNKPIAIQTLGEITKQNTYGVQLTGFITKEFAAGIEFLAFVTQNKTEGLQFTGIITKQNTYGTQFLGFITKEALAGIQFDGFITKNKPEAVQFEGVITKERTYAEQFLGFITKEPAYGVQFDSVYENVIAVQFKTTLYNDTNLRILLDFPSRGLTGTNWTATSTQSSASNSFSVNNLNTDVVEQYWRSATGVTSSVTLTCDTELAQGVYLDTLAIMNHNFSGGAVVRLQSSNFSNFGTLGDDIELEIESTNMYYIAPSLPLQAYRYWRLIIQDVANPDGFIRVGTIVFGSAIVFSNESFLDRVRFGKVQYVDKVFTEGFTNISNDRGKKSFLELDFKNLIYSRPNWQNMNEIFNVAGITLKCLWIPVPKQASRFALFGKLTEIPVQEHNYKTEDADYVDFSVKVDESL